MSLFSTIWSDVQTVAKPFIASVPIVGSTIASRINMSPTPAQAATQNYLAPTAAATGTDIQNAMRVGSAVAAGQSPGVVAQLGTGGLILAAVVVVLLAFMVLRRE